MSLSVSNQDLLLAGRQLFAWPLMTGWPTTLWKLRLGPKMFANEFNTETLTAGPTAGSAVSGWLALCWSSVAKTSERL